MAALLVAFLPQAGTPVAAQDNATSSVASNSVAADSLANVELPPDRGQTDMQVYVPDTGHTVRGSMLDYWRANGATSVYGEPISEPFAAANGYYSQAFQDAVFQYRPEYVDTNDPIMRLMPIGETALHDRLGTVRADGKRGAGGGDRRAAAWNRLDPNSATATKVVNNGGTFDADSGHTISGTFLKWYNAHEGGFYLGDPISEPAAERGAIVQYFSGALLMQADNSGAVYLAPLAQEQASQLGIDTTPVSQGDAPVYDESLFQTADNPNPQGDPNAPGRHWVEVSISQEQLWAYQGDTVVMTTLVSTGLSPNVTAPGLFHVRLKFPKQTMEGFINDTGEVSGFGDTPPPDGGSHWVVPDVPNVMYFNTDAEALHGTYWHNNFGNPMSHGCVNLPLDVAAWMYGWAPLGTEVWIHE